MDQKEDIIKGSSYAVAAFFLMAIFGILTKIAYSHGSAIWVSFITYLTGSAALVPVLVTRGIGFLRSDHYGYLYGRAIFGTAASFLYMLSMKYIPIVNATLLFNTAPIFIPFLAIFWLKNPVTPRVWLAVLLGFIGIVVIIRPTEEIFTQEGNLIALASGIALAIAYTMVKILSPTDPASRIIFYYLFIGTLLQLPLLYIAGPLPPLDTCLLAAICGLVLMIVQFLLVKAYTYAQVAHVGVFQYASVVFVGILNWMIWNIIPPPIDLLGVALVTIAGIMIIRSQKKVSV